MDLKNIGENLFYAISGNYPVMIGVLSEALIVVSIIVVFKAFPKSGFVVLFDMMFEKVYDFFEDLLGNEEKDWIKMYVTVLFFIILISNFFGVFLEILLPAFGLEHGHAVLAHYIVIPTATKEFNIAMALVGVVIVIYEQFRSLGLIKFFYEYFPIFGKGYVPYTRGKLPLVLDWMLFLVVKIFDIVISMFLGILEIIGLVAKVVSLSFRLFGNMFSGGILLAMLMGAAAGLTMTLANIEFPIVVPVIIYIQEMLVALIQAFVFPLLIAIFVKVAKLH